MKRRLQTFALPALVAVTAGAHAFGGWAVVTIDDLPTQLTVGKPTTFTFVVRQHGFSLMNDVKPTLEAKAGSMIGGATVNVAATRTNVDGQYSAALTVP